MASYIWLKSWYSLSVRRQRPWGTSSLAFVPAAVEPRHDGLERLSGEPGEDGIGRLHEGDAVPLALTLRDRLQDMTRRVGRRAAHHHPQALEAAYFDVQACNDTNRVDIFVFTRDDQVMLIARMDNLGKGASGAAVQSMNLHLGIDEATGLV